MLGRPRLPAFRQRGDGNAHAIARRSVLFQQVIRAADTGRTILTTKKRHRSS